MLLRNKQEQIVDAQKTWKKLQEIMLSEKAHPFEMDIVWFYLDNILGMKNYRDVKQWWPGR